MNTIKGVYFEEGSSNPYKAEVSIHPHFLKIDFPENQEKRSLTWDHNKVHTSDIPGSQKVYINYGENPAYSIEVDAIEFFEIIKSFSPQVHYLKSPRNYRLSGGLKWLAVLVIFFISLAVLVYFLILPLVTKLVIEAIPVEKEIEIGKHLAQSALQGEKINEEKTAIVNKFLNNLKINSEYPIHITVIESEVKNAFAIPGGEIAIYTGLLNEMNHHSELVALLGHEIAHIEKRHTLKTMLKSMGLYLMIAGVFQDIGGIVAVLADNASELEKLSYNRSLESEADDIGLEIVINNNVDPKGMIDLFNLLKGDKSTDITPEFLTTHPSLDKRIETLQNKIPDLKYTVAPNDSLIFYWEKLMERKTINPKILNN
ncbi:MAG TPA: M48 family metallopeptidase [Cytophagales bacterium]|nr:M48 family metallopeptidase [Cytophagales bacterium]